MSEITERLKRLTYDKPQGMYESLHNTAYAKDREVFLRGLGIDGSDIDLCKYIAAQCKELCNIDISDIPPEDFGEHITCDCIVSVAYFLAAGAAGLREKLKGYENADPASGGGSARDTQENRKMSLGHYLEEIKKERIRQDEKLGKDNHHPTTWMSIIGEEFGELCKAVNELTFDSRPILETIDDIRNEAIQVAACCIALLECMDRIKKGSEF